MNHITWTTKIVLAAVVMSTGLVVYMIIPSVPKRAPALAPALTKIDKCANAKNDEGCGDNETPDCVSTVDDNHCVIHIKKPTQTQLDKLESETTAKFDAKYCKKMSTRVSAWVVKANAYNLTSNENRHTPECLSRMRNDFRAIDSLYEEVSNTQNDNLWRLGSSHGAMKMTLLFAKNCLSCSDKQSNQISCADMRDTMNRVNCVP